MTVVTQHENVTSKNRLSVFKGKMLFDKIDAVSIKF